MITIRAGDCRFLFLTNGIGCGYKFITACRLDTVLVICPRVFGPLVLVDISFSLLGWAGQGVADRAFGRLLRSSQLFPFFVLFFRLYIILPAFGKVINLKREFLSLPVRLPMQMRHLNFMLSVIAAVLTGAHGFHKGSNVLQ